MRYRYLMMAGMSLLYVQRSAAQQKDYRIQPVAFTSVQVNDAFWKPKMDVNATVTIPYVLQKCRENGRVDNFLRAAKKMDGDKLTEYPFDDTDIYKVIEGASYAMQVKDDPKLDHYVDTLIQIIGQAQEPDGYLYTFRTINPAKPHPWVGEKRWQKEEELSHELYNSGHLFEAAAAHYTATGKRTLLNIALKNADLLVRDLGPGKEKIYPGHQVVEIGLVRLYRITKQKKYLDLAKHFLDIRGPGGTEYNQADKRPADQHAAEGHAVRAAYMYTGMADVAALTGDKTYLTAIDDIWKDVIGHKLYLTGGIGATGNGEAFGANYQLPNMSAYAETCASIANVYWNNRMFLLHGDARYIDVLERTLYNGLLSGVSLSGDHFFYPNPLASMGQHARSAWFSCACCISNMTRFLPSVPGYVYAVSGNDLYVNLFMGNHSTIMLPATKVNISQTTDYPWQGTIKINVDPDKASAFALKVRIPGWAQGQPIPGDLYTYAASASRPVSLLVNGKPVPMPLQLTNGYATINKIWKKGDVVTLELPMEPQKVLANAQVKDDVGRFAIQRGPVVYCLEGPDNRDSVVQNIMIDKNAPLTYAYEGNFLNGVTTIKAQGSSAKRLLNSDQVATTQQQVKAIPYYVWNNRGNSEMTVWIPYEASAARPKAAPTIAATSKVSSSLLKARSLKAINDQYDPESSADNNYPYFHWWPKKNTTEFVEYTFDKPHTVSSSKVYWYDDGPFGGCRVPASYRILYQRDGQWMEVKTTTPYTIAKDSYNAVSFDPVNTTALRLEVKLPVDNSTGIHEWIVK
ncbi:glycoside hydrolase family 127 protein [Mucilaginibacter daejeonensis]|uniref:glycoside hydrolase family 127 protein n=1 Tax=Mucilaginibacter daejeonensis TaxID=398049 RepID=UPI001D17D39F|nr:glycoside hydrolase family 127 protein [Mucilaginibacter daejeonensis]UEG52585.1 glycoside hydrolase family 127 protein [Mucilaginibacter daejeonensis]